MAYSARTDRHTVGLTDRQTYRQTDKQTDIQTDRYTDRWYDEQTDKKVKTKGYLLSLECDHWRSNYMFSEILFLFFSMSSFIRSLIFFNNFL